MGSEFAKPAPTPGLTSADWAGENARRWAAVADHLEAQLEPVGDLLDRAAAVRAGEHVLDVGCGRGVTTRRAAQAATPGGRATGLDISQALIDEARARTPADLDVDWVVADAQHHVFGGPQYDVLVSRFGVMFFDDEVAALTNLRSAVRPGGRLCVVVWQPRHRSEVMQLPVDVAMAAAARHGVELDVGPADGGAFTWGDPTRVVQLLESAGWREVAYDRHRMEMYVSGPGPVERIVDTSLSMGDVRRALVDQPPELADAVRGALTEEYRQRHDGTGVRLEGAVAVATATSST